MQRKEWTAAHFAHTTEVRDTVVRVAGPNFPMYRRPHRGLLRRQSRGHGSLDRGGGLPDPASGSARAEPYAGTSPSWSRSPGDPRATPSHSELGY